MTGLWAVFGGVVVVLAVGLVGLRTGTRGWCRYEMRVLQEVR